MKLALVVQMGDHVPRVTHHADVMMARMELGTFLETEGYSKQNPVVLVDMEKTAFLEVNKTARFPNGFIALIEIDELKPILLVLHLWKPDNSVSELAVTPHPGMASVKDQLGRCLEHQEQRDHVLEHGYFSFVAKQDDMNCDIFMVDTLDPEETMF